MKKGIIYVVLIAVLGFAAWYLLRQNRQNTSIAELEAEYAFSIEDTAAVTKIIIQDKTPNKVTLTRENGKWHVNGKYEARRDGIKVLLETIHDMKMRNFVPNSSKKAIIERLAVYGKEVEIYQGDNLVKHLYVGTETADQTATYMMIKGASQPFSVHIQGFVGYLNSRFFIEENLWRRRLLYGLEKDNIAKVELTYPSEEGSFVLDNTGDKPVVYDQNGNVVSDVLDINLNIFLGSFRTAAYEGEVVPTDGIWMKLDSISRSEPKFILTVTDNKGETNKLLAFRKKPNMTEQMNEEDVVEWDPSRLYARLQDGRWVVIQYFGLRNIIVGSDFFTTELLIDN